MTMEIVAIISPKEGKADRVEELLVAFTEYVHTNEPGALRYHLHKEVGKDVPEYVMIESYQDEESYNTHNTSQFFQDTVKKCIEEDLLAKELVILNLKPIAGFASR